MTFLWRLVPYMKWILAAIGILTVGGSIMYAWNASVDREIAQRSYEQAVEQLNSVTKELEREQARREQENQRVDQAEKEAAEIEDANDPAPESTKHLLNRLYGD